MQEIRFREPEIPRKEEPEVENKPKKEGQNPVFGFFKVLAKVVLVLAILYGAIILSKYVFAIFNEPIEERYSAVFLGNGQVYFGLIKENNKNEIILSKVFYLQGDTNQNAVSGHFNLVKLGTELHGPEDELYINKSQTVFYEYLRSDSKLLESIKGYSNQ